VNFHKIWLMGRSWTAEGLIEFEKRSWKVIRNNFWTVIGR